MKIRRLNIILALSLLLCLTASAVFGRAWTSYTGKMFYGEFKYNLGESVVLEDETGRRVTIPFSDLSREDREYLFPGNRKWISGTGDSVEGRLAELEGSDVWIETFDDRSFMIPFSQLSPGDQSYIRRNSLHHQLQTERTSPLAQSSPQASRPYDALSPKKPSLAHRRNQSKSYLPASRSDSATSSIYSGGRHSHHDSDARAITLVVVLLLLIVWGWKMRDRLGCLFYGVYVIMGLVQLAAILGGIEDWWGWPWWIAIFIAIPLAYIPVLGTVVGIMGAIHSFGWTPLAAILLFCWPYVLYFILLAHGGLSAIFSSDHD